METSLEFLKTRKRGREVHRHWHDEVKAKIVSGSLRPGTIGEMRAFFYPTRARYCLWRSEVLPFLALNSRISSDSSRDSVNEPTRR
jgi:hypothetical protein